MPYCGVGKIPKGERRGTAIECMENNQIRYYGLEKLGGHPRDVVLGLVERDPKLSIVQRDAFYTGLRITKLKNEMRENSEFLNSPLSEKKRIEILKERKGLKKEIMEKKQKVAKLRETLLRLDKIRKEEDRRIKKIWRKEAEKKQIQDEEEQEAKDKRRAARKVIRRKKRKAVAKKEEEDSD